MITNQVTRITNQVTRITNQVTRIIKPRINNQVTRITNPVSRITKPLPKITKPVLYHKITKDNNTKIDLELKSQTSTKVDVSTSPQGKFYSVGLQITALDSTSMGILQESSTAQNGNKATGKSTRKFLIDEESKSYDSIESYLVAYRITK